MINLFIGILLSVELCSALPTMQHGSPAQVVLILWTDVNESIDIMIRQRALIENSIMTSMPQASRVILKSVGYSSAQAKEIFDVNINDELSTWTSQLHAYQRSNDNSFVSATSIRHSIKDVLLGSTENKRDTPAEIVIIVTSTEARLVNDELMKRAIGTKKTYLVLGGENNNNSEIWENVATDFDHVFRVTDFDNTAFSKLFAADSKLVCDINQFLHPVRMACSKCSATCSMNEPLWTQQSRECRTSCKYFLCQYWNGNLSVCPVKPCPSAISPDPEMSRAPKVSTGTKPPTAANDTHDSQESDKTALQSDSHGKGGDGPNERHLYPDHTDPTHGSFQKIRSSHPYSNGHGLSNNYRVPSSASGRIEYLAIAIIIPIAILTGIEVCMRWCKKTYKNKKIHSRDDMTIPLTGQGGADIGNDNPCKNEYPEDENGVTRNGDPVAHPDGSSSVPQSPFPNRDARPGPQLTGDSGRDHLADVRPMSDQQPMGDSGGDRQPTGPRSDRQPTDGPRSDQQPTDGPRSDQQPPTDSLDRKAQQKHTNSPYDLMDGTTFMANGLAYDLKDLHQNNTSYRQ